MIIRRAEERGCFDHGWLKTCHTFSFGDYYDEAWMGFKTLRVMNEDHVAPGKGFDLHGHRDMEILTYVMEGSLRHVDTMGNNEVLRAGEVQRMTAGSGIRHMELNASQAVTCHLYQIWIVPETNGLSPGYGQKPFRDRLEQQRRVLVASRDGRDESLKTHQDAEVWLRKLGEGESATLSLPAGKEVWMQVVAGEALLPGGERVGAGDGVTSSETLSLKAPSAFEAIEFIL